MLGVERKTNKRSITASKKRKQRAKLNKQDNFVFVFCIVTVLYRQEGERLVCPLPCLKCNTFF